MPHITPNGFKGLPPNKTMGILSSIKAILQSTDTHVDTRKTTKDYHRKKHVTLRFDNSIHQQYKELCHKHHVPMSLALEYHMRDDLNSLFNRQFKKVLAGRHKTQ